MCLSVCCFQSLEECESHGLPNTEQGRLDLELKIEDTKENMRKAEVCDIYLLSCYLSHVTEDKLLDILSLSSMTFVSWYGEIKKWITCKYTVYIYVAAAVSM